MKYIFLVCMIMLNACGTETMITEDKIAIKGDNIKIKYINFKPKQVNKACLGTKIDKLMTIIHNEKKSRSIFANIPPNEYFTEKYKKEREEIKRLRGELLQKKHISVKGNHEWRNLISSKHIVIENIKDNLYVMYPLDPYLLIISGKSFEKIEKGEIIMVRGLKHWIDVKECIGNDNIQFK